MATPHPTANQLHPSSRHGKAGWSPPRPQRIRYLARPRRRKRNGHSFGRATLVREKRGPKRQMTGSHPVQSLHAGRRRALRRASVTSFPVG